MSLAFLILAQTAVGVPTGPDLAEVERAVGKCDSGVMTRIFAGEPQRRRAAMIAIFNEQQAIVEARRTLAQQRFEAMNKVLAPAAASAATPTPVSAAAPAPSPTFDTEAQLLADRQQALDDARMLGSMRDTALDMMRQQYLVGCNGSLASAGK